MTEVRRQAPLAMLVPDWIDQLLTDPYMCATYQRLVRRADGKGLSFESVENMAAAKGMSRRRMQRALAELEDVGLIRRQFRGNQSTLYWILASPAKRRNQGALDDQHEEQSESDNQAVRTTRPSSAQETTKQCASGADEVFSTEVLNTEVTTKKKEIARSLKNQAQEIVDLYNEHRGTEPNAMPRVDLLNKGRHQRIKQAINDYGFEKVKELMVKACKNRVADPERFYAKNNHGLDALLADQKFIKYAEAYDHQQTQHTPQPDVRLRANEKQWAYEDATEEWLALTPEERETITIDDLVARNEERMLNAKRNRNQNN